MFPVGIEALRTDREPDTEISVESISAVIEFLGYDPFRNQLALSERLAALRRAKGWTMKQAAVQLGVDEVPRRSGKKRTSHKRHQAIM
jgi:hypothetical protein